MNKIKPHSKVDYDKSKHYPMGFEHEYARVLVVRPFDQKDEAIVYYLQSHKNTTQEYPEKEFIRDQVNEGRALSFESFEKAFAWASGT